MRLKILATALALISLPAVAQVGGTGVVRNAGGGGANGSGVIGFNVTQAPKGLTDPSLCVGAPFSVNGQIRAYILLYNAAGQPFYVPGC